MNEILATKVLHLYFREGTDALSLCNMLVKIGYDKQSSQLAMQRAIDKGYILLLNSYEMVVHPEFPNKYIWSRNV